LVLPPKLAPYQVVIVPIYKGEQELQRISEKVNEITQKLRNIGVTVKYDNRDSQKPGWKFAEYELKGVPVRIAIGPRDLENGTAEVARRDELTKEVVSMEGIETYVKNLLDTIQENIFKKALKYREEHTTKVQNYDEFKDILENKGGFVLAHWDGTPETEERIKNETKATIRNIPAYLPEEDGVDMITGKPSKRRVLFAKAY